MWTIVIACSLRSRAFRVAQPDSSVLSFPRIEGLSDSFNFALQLLRETKVSVAPGVPFGNGGGAMRICAASDLSVLEPAWRDFVGLWSGGERVGMTR